jgi:chaperonin GroEL (HSP60 family)
LVTRTPIEARTTQTSSEIEFNNPSELKMFLEKEEGSVKKIVNSIKDSGASIVLCQKGISDSAQELMSKKGILAIRRIRERDINDLLMVTGARQVSDLNDINKSDLGQASVTTEKISSEKMTVITGKGSIKTILVRGSTQQLIDEAEKAVNNALGVINSLRKDKAFVPGAGAIESIISRDLSNKNLTGKDSLAYKSFAKALMIIKKSLIKNSGFKGLALSDDKGISVEGKQINSLEKGVIEPLMIKKQAVTSAAETAIMILRINDLLTAK